MWGYVRLIEGEKIMIMEGGGQEGKRGGWGWMRYSMKLNDRW